MNAEAIEIRRELVINAPVEAVWSKLASVQGMSEWFAKNLTGKMEVGEMIDFAFGGEGPGKHVAVIEAVDPMTHFAYRWHPGDTDFRDHPAEEMTLVSFWLEPQDGATKLTMVESGFERIPESRRSEVVGMNTTGWDEELVSLKKYVESL